MEEWRNVPGFKGRYQIDISTKEGRCRSTNYRRTGKTVIFANVLNNCGRICWRLYNEKKGTMRQAAYWIAITYPELVQNEYFEGAEIDHIDTDRLNNHPSNLRWVTRSGNMLNSLTRKHRSEAMSIVMKGHKGYWAGKKMPEEMRKKMSAAHKKREP